MSSPAMRALVISADRFEDSELSEPLRQLTAKGVAVDIAAPHKGVITGKHGYKVEAALALDEVQPERYELLLLPGGKVSCVSCHRPYSQRHGALVAQEPDLCFHCHDK